MYVYIYIHTLTRSLNCLCLWTHPWFISSPSGGVALACRYCRHPATTQLLRRFLPLPSEALDDVADFMLCFR